MSHRYRIFATAALTPAALVLLLSLPAPGRADPTPGQRDDFQDASTRDWQGHAPSLQVVADGGPGGDGDAWLRVESSGLDGAGGRLVSFSRQGRWTGDYPGAGVAAVRLMARNLGQSTAVLRLGLSPDGSRGGDWRVSARGVELPPGGPWQEVVFPVDDAALAQVSGDSEFDTAMSSVLQIRFLVNDSLDYRGGLRAHVIGLDDIEALDAEGLQRVFGDGFEGA